MKKAIIALLVFCCMAVGNKAQAYQKDDALNMGQVVVTATKTEHSLESVPVAVQVVTEADFKERNVKTVQEALELLPGVRVTKNSGSWGDKGHVQIQGMDASHTLILVDGQSFAGGHGNATDMQSISLNMVQRIEVVQGPASALYGSDAVGGVVNIITKTSVEEPFVSLETSLGSRSTLYSSLSAGGSTEKVDALVGYAYNRSNGVSESSDKYHENIFNGSLKYQASDQLKFTVKPYYSLHQQESTGRKQERIGLNSIAEWSPDELSNMTVRGSFLDYRHWTKNKSSNWDNDTYEGEINYSRVLFDRHTLTGGYQIVEEEIDDKGKIYEADQTTHSFFLQDEIDMDPFTLVLGARLDEHDRWGTEFNPKAAVAYKIHENFKLKASVGTAFKAPTLTELYADGWSMGPYVVNANPDLKPEESIGYQFGGEYTFWEKFLAKATLFRNEVDNLISYTVNHSGPPPWQMDWLNVDEAVMQGVELSLNAPMTEDFDVNVGYTFTDTEDKSTKKDLVEKPRHKVTLDLGYDIPVIDVRANFEANYFGRSYGDKANTDPIDHYLVLNLALTKDLNEDAQVFTRIENLTGKKQVSIDYDLDGTEFLAGMRVKF